MSWTLQTPADLDLDNPLWRFAGKLWADKTVEQTCLALQARGWNVTRILCALWQASLGRSFPGREDDSVLRWRSGITEPLRRVRLSIAKGNPGTEPARQSVARSELEAERVELALAYRALGGRMAEARPPMDSIKPTALENLQAAAPESTMDKDTGSLLSTLAQALENATREEASPC